jgi:hypothetical protein
MTMGYFLREIAVLSQNYIVNAYTLEILNTVVFATQLFRATSSVREATSRVFASTVQDEHEDKQFLYKNLEEDLKY